MDDADDTRRNLIFNTLANLPQDVLEDIRWSLTRHGDDTPPEYLLEIVNELIGEPKEFVGGKHAGRGDRDKEAALNHVWKRLTPEINCMVYSLATKTRVERALEIEFDRIEAWWDGLDVATKERELWLTGLWTKE